MKLTAKFVKVLIVFLAVVIGASAYYFFHRSEISTDDAAIEGLTVVISPKVQGYVKTLNVQDNQLVKAGDVLLEIDPTDYIIRRDRAKAALDAAKAAANASHSNLETTTVSAPSNMDAAAAQVAAAQATWEKSLADRQRNRDRKIGPFRLEQAAGRPAFSPYGAQCHCCRQRDQRSAPGPGQPG